MPIDTRNKRASAVGFKGQTRSVFPNPDGSLANAEDRRHIANEYAGALAAPADDGGGQRRRRRGE